MPPPKIKFCCKPILILKGLWLLGIVRHHGRLLDADVGPDAVFLLYEGLDFVVEGLDVDGLEVGEVHAKLEIEFLGLSELLLAHLGLPGHVQYLHFLRATKREMSVGFAAARLESLRRSGMLFRLFHALGESCELFYVQVTGHRTGRKHGTAASVVIGWLFYRIWVLD